MLEGDASAAPTGKRTFRQCGRRRAVGQCRTAVTRGLPGASTWDASRRTSRLSHLPARLDPREPRPASAPAAEHNPPRSGQPPPLVSGSRPWALTTRRGSPTSGRCARPRGRPRRGAGAWRPPAPASEHNPPRSGQPPPLVSGSRPWALTTRRGSRTAGRCARPRRPSPLTNAALAATTPERHSGADGDSTAAPAAAATVPAGAWARGALRGACGPLSQASKPTSWSRAAWCRSPRSRARTR